MAKSVNREDAFTIAGSHGSQSRATETDATTTDTPAQADSQEKQSVETKVRKSKTTAKKQADNSDTRPVTCYMPQNLYKRLRMEAFERDSSMTNLIIMAVEEFLDD